MIPQTSLLFTVKEGKVIFHYHLLNDLSIINKQHVGAVLIEICDFHFWLLFWLTKINI